MPSKYKEDFISEAVSALPTKRLFDFGSSKLRECTKLAKEFELTSPTANEVILKVKMVGINYQHDFQTFKKPSSLYNTNLTRLSSRGPKSSSSHESISALVPGNKIIGKVHLTSNHPDLDHFKQYTNAKYLVFPYTNCINQNRNTCCRNCEKLASHYLANLSYKSYKYHHKYPCEGNLIYGSTIDGGLQDYLKIPNPTDTLIRIPEHVSLHDCCFLLDTMLPFYSFIKDHLMDNLGADPTADEPGLGNMLIILNNITKEINDILIVIEHFQISQKTVTFIDRKKIANLSDTEKLNYKKKYSQVFVFSVCDESVRFATNCAVSPGLESTKSRYNIVLFDQHNPESLSKNKYLNKYHNDKTIHQFKLTYKDKINTEELMRIIASLNKHARRTKEKPRHYEPEPPATNPDSRPSIGSIESTGTTFSTGDQSIHSDSTSTTVSSKNGENCPPVSKTLRFRDNESIIDTCNSSSSSSSNSSAVSSHYSWLWYDKDFDLCHDHEQSDDDDENDYDHPGYKKNHTTKHINRLIKNPSHLSRVCYTNRSYKPAKLNAFIFS